MEITEEEFRKLLNEFEIIEIHVDKHIDGVEYMYKTKVGEFFQNITDHYSTFTYGSHYKCFGELEDYVKEHLRKPEAKLDKKLCDTVKIYTLSEKYDDAKRIMVRQNSYGLFNLYLEKECNGNTAFQVNDVVQADSCDEVVKSLGYEVENS